MAYSEVQIESFRKELDLLETSETNLSAGRAVAQVVIDGDIVQYHRADIPLLTRRIGELKSILSEIDNADQYATSFKIFSGKGL